MKFAFEVEEAGELLRLIVGRILDEAKLSAKDRAAVLRWHSQTMRAGSPGMRELTEQVNADLDRALQTRSRSALVKPDWK